MGRLRFLSSAMSNLSNGQVIKLLHKKEVKNKGQHEHIPITTKYEQVTKNPKTE